MSEAKQNKTFRRDFSFNSSETGVGSGREICGWSSPSGVPPGTGVWGILGLAHSYSPPLRKASPPLMSSHPATLSNVK